MKITRLPLAARSSRKHLLRNLAALSTHLCLLVPFAACGDDSVDPGDPEPTPTTTTETPEPPSTSTTGDDSPTTGDDTPTTGDDTPTTGDDTSTTDEMPMTTGDDSTTGTPTGCLGLVGSDDDDGDGVANTGDNCPCDPNPNQLDFDGNTLGNVCDLPLKFSLIDGAQPELNQLTTKAHAKKALECEFAVDLIPRDGIVEVSLDDSGTARLHLASIQYTDTPELLCNLGVGLLVKVKVQQFLATGIDPFTVTFPFALSDHEAGHLTGMTDAPHKILAGAIINVTETPNEILLPKGEEPLMDVPGVFPTAMIHVTDAEEQISLTFTDDALILFEQTTEAGITFKLTGLTGTLRLKR